MSITIGGYNFDGPHMNTAQLRSQSGVYAILGHNGTGQWNVVDIGESADVRNRVDCHDRADCWKRRGHSTLAAAALYVPETQRMQIEQQLRKQYNPPCGEC